jgi:CBS domain containing-hemolysin-like protein
MTLLIWLGIFLCLAQSAMFSGLNLAFFSLGRLQLEAEAQQGCPRALKVLLLRTRSNLLLCTILWGNVSVNVALALLSDSVMTGMFAFIFSTCGITFLGEILPQAYFSRHALRVGSMLAPVIRFYQIILWPVARPCSWFLDRWIGEEGPLFYDEEDFRMLLQRHTRERGTDIGQVEGRGALNFLRLDDLRVSGEGRSVEIETILPMADLNAPDLAGKLSKIAHKWAIFTDAADTPLQVLNLNEYLRASFQQSDRVDPWPFCHPPIVVDDANETLERALTQLVVESDRHDDRVIDGEVILYWSPNSKRIVTGPDLLGRLLHGIARREFEPKTV